MKLVSTRTFSLCSVHNVDKSFRIFLRLEISSFAMLESGVIDRGVSVSTTAVSSPSEGDDAVDENVSWPLAASSSSRAIAVGTLDVHVSVSNLIVLGELILSSMFSLTFGNVRSRDGSNIERNWNSTVNIRNTDCEMYEDWLSSGLINSKGSMRLRFSFFSPATPRKTIHGSLGFNSSQS